MGSKDQWTAVTFSSDTPQLLMRTRFDRTGYRIQLTDLSRIWEETVSKKDIIKRAIETGCSFNPGDDDGNYDTFLKCIKRALNGDAKTTSNLRAAEPGKLLIELSTPLSGGLSDLKWTVELDQLPESAVATEIVGPLLLQANSLQHQIQQLVEEISSKDHVIQKITDKLEATGSDLTAVFPGVSNVKTSKKRSQSQRSQFAGHVKGLADFDEASWRASHKDLCEGQEMTPDVMTTVMRDLPSPGRVEQPIESWVQNLSGGRNRSQGRSKGSTRIKNHHEDSAAPEPDTQDEGFQRQETPPHLSKQSPAEKVPVRHDTAPENVQPAQPAGGGDDSETEDEDEDCLDIPPTTSQQQAIGTIEPSEEPSTTRTDGRPGGLAKVQSPQLDLDDETDDPVSSPPIPKSQVKMEMNDAESEAELEKPVRKGGLGKFGGSKAKSPPKAKESEEESAPTPSKPKGTLSKFGGKKAQPSVPPPEPVDSTSKPKSTLGRFGGKAKDVSTSHTSKREEQDESTVGSGNVEPKTGFSRRSESQAAPERELTEEEKQQRADEKREKLKRELEEKAKGPVKKKRKF